VACREKCSWIHLLKRLVSWMRGGARARDLALHITTIELSAPGSVTPALRRGVVLPRASRDARWSVATHHPADPSLLPPLRHHTPLSSCLPDVSPVSPTRSRPSPSQSIAPPPELVLPEPAACASACSNATPLVIPTPKSRAVGLRARGSRRDQRAPPPAPAPSAGRCDEVGLHP